MSRLTLPMVKLLIIASKVQGCKDFGNHLNSVMLIAVTDYPQMSNHMPRFQSL